MWQVLDDPAHQYLDLHARDISFATNCGLKSLGRWTTVHDDLTPLSHLTLALSEIAASLFWLVETAAPSVYPLESVSGLSGTGVPPLVPELFFRVGRPDSTSVGFIFVLDSLLQHQSCPPTVSLFPSSHPWLGQRVCARVGWSSNTNADTHFAQSDPLTRYPIPATGGKA